MQYIDFRARILRTYATIFLVSLICNCTALQGRESVVLLHGLARSSSSMGKLELALAEAGYDVLNISYPSRQYSIETLARKVRNEIDELDRGSDVIHFVTHSMGGILLRYIQKNYPVQNIGRSVMLSPPNHGSEVVDTLSGWSLFKSINGAAGLQLGTGVGGIPAELGSVDFEVGIITGDRSINWILSMMIPGKDDGKVSIESAKVEGMSAFKVVHATHAFIMQRSLVIRDVIAFLQTGRFTAESF